MASSRFSSFRVNQVIQRGAPSQTLGSSHLAVTSTSQTLDRLNLMALPLEIRNAIYLMYLGDLCIVIRNRNLVALRETMKIPLWCPGRRLGWNYFDDDKIGPNPGALLATCRQIRRETISVFYREAIFYFERRYDVIHTHNRGQLRLRIADPNPVLIRTLVRPLQHMRKMNIDLSKSVGCEGSMAACESRRRVKAIIDIIRFSMPRLKHLQLEIDFRANVFESNRMLEPWFIRALYRLTKLEYLSIAFKGIGILTRSPRLLDAATIILAAQGVINWHSCGAGRNAGATITRLAKDTVNNDQAVRLWFCNEVLVFLRQTSSSLNNHSRLIALLEDDLADLVQPSA